MSGCIWGEGLHFDSWFVTIFFLSIVINKFLWSFKILKCNVCGEGQTLSSFVGCVKGTSLVKDTRGLVGFCFFNVGCVKGKALRI